MEMFCTCVTDHKVPIIIHCTGDGSAKV